jgi:hypothetical protein
MFKKLISIVLVIVSLVLSGIAVAQEPTPYPGVPAIENCDKEQLHDWLLNRRAWMLATGDVLQALSDIYIIWAGCGNDV